ncbi:MAG: NAD(P)H-dependent oxidoreductase [bacterium]
MRLIERLHALEREGRPIPVAVIGAGQMGSGVARGVAHLPGMRVAGICDLLVDRAAAAAAQAEVAAVEAGSPDAVRRIVAEGRTVITARAASLIEAPEVIAVVDATGDPETGARLALGAISHGKAFITMNVEADVTVGPLLAHQARSAGTVYTVAAGDEPSVLCEMVDFARAAGLEVVCAGKGKNNRLDRTATAASVAPEAAARAMSARMLASFVDGTKTMVELAALANATALHPDRPGLHGPRADLSDVLRTFIPEDDGGILRTRGVVEYAIGDVAPGVFLVVTTSNGAIRRDLAYLKAGDGPYYLLYRPYHLASLEAPLSVARAVIYGEVTMAALGAPLAECVAVAKRDLRAGELLDGIGGESTYGLADTAARAATAGAVPIGVTYGARVRRDVSRGTVLTNDDVALDEASTIVDVRRLQDVMARDGRLQPAGRTAAVAVEAAGQAGGTAC